MSEWAICSKKQAIRSFTHFWWATWANCSWLLIFGEQPERFAHIAHFWWVTLAIHSHHSIKKREWAHGSFIVSIRANERFAKKTSDSLICSFIMSDLSKSLKVTLLSWATWAICSRSLFWHERPKRFAHNCSFVLSDLSELLTVAHLIWAIWANEQMRDERMSKFPTL